MKKRAFLSDTFKLEDRASISIFYEKLLLQQITSKEQAEERIHQRDELDCFLDEDFAKRYIKNSRFTDDESAKQEYIFFLEEILPKRDIVSNELDQKIQENKIFSQIDREGFQTTLKTIHRATELFRKENVDLQTEDQKLGQQYSEIIGSQSCEIDGENMTLQKASQLLEKNDRSLRKRAYEAIQLARFQNKEKIDSILDQLIQVRTKIAQNAGFSSFKDYKFQQMCRFDYTQRDVDTFRQSIKKYISPLLKKIGEKRKKSLGFDTLKPYDLEVDVLGREPLKTFENERDLIEKTKLVMSKIDPEFANYIDIMDKGDFFDLDTRKGKASGGYNYPLMVTGVPFIFMNATNNLQGLITMVHEAGHAVHTFLTNNLPIRQLRSTPSEIAELASMSMELLTMPYRSYFLPNSEDQQRAKEEKIEEIVSTFTRIAVIDEFQGRLYDHPGHSRQDRHEKWTEIYNSYMTNSVDRSEYEHYKEIFYQKQSHIFSVPFYYIEYAIAQLGAIGVRISSQSDYPNTIKNYKEALSYGYTKSMKEIYEKAGSKCDFSDEHIKNIALFLEKIYFLHKKIIFG
ncbi:MAG TPA: M3 family oligoendopeptidase [Candidatus Absconditabacterales bacterium]|nr:M3 family oligoendopeptidase [Candidatus Absconditabacterales bacterium]